MVTEFLHDVPFAGKYNTISCASGHHLYEGRWMHDKRYVTDYARFWLCENASPRQYSTWLADAVLALCKVSGDFTLAESLFEGLKRLHSEWETERLSDNGLFYQDDDREGMEMTISQKGYRPATNSYMYGDAIAIAEIAERLDRSDDAALYREKAAKLRKSINTLLWDHEAEFFKTRTCFESDPNYNIKVWYESSIQYSLIEDGGLVNVREENGFIPWYFNIPNAEKSVAWKFLNDEKYFKAPYGPTTAEQNHPDFMYSSKYACMWNGPSWPYATTQTLVALGNLICNYKQHVMTEADYFDLLHTYANSHFLTMETGERIPFIDENLDPYSGEWLARKLLSEKNPQHSDAHRGKDYNHSGFCDLVLSGLAGIRAESGHSLLIHPLFSEDQLDYFCADGILYHGHTITVLWDRTGEKYGMGAGFKVLSDGSLLVAEKDLSAVRVEL